MILRFALVIPLNQKNKLTLKSKLELPFQASSFYKFIEKLVL